MSDRMTPGPVSALHDNCEAVCIHTKKIYDSCREEDIPLLKYIFFHNTEAPRVSLEASAIYLPHGLSFFQP